MPASTPLKQLTNQRLQGAVGCFLLGWCLSCNTPAPPEKTASAATYPRDTLAYNLFLKADAFYYAETSAPDSTLYYARASAARAIETSDWHTWGIAQTYILAANYALNNLDSTAATLPHLEKTARQYIPQDSAFWTDYYNTAAAIFNGLGKYDLALEYGRQEISFYEKTGNKASLALANNNVCTYYLNRGDYDRALDYGLAALQLYTSLPDSDPMNVVWTYDNLCKIWYRNSNYKDLITHAEKGLQLLKTTCGNQSSEDCLKFQISLQLVQASACVDLGEFEKALQLFKHALQLQEGHAPTGNLAITLDGIGFVYTSMHQKEDAKKYMERAYAAADPKDFFFGKICRHMGFMQLLHGEYRKALASKQEALQVLTGVSLAGDLYKNPTIYHVNAYYDVMHALIEKGDILRTVADQEHKPELIQKSLETYELAIAVLDSMRNIYQEGSKKFWNQEARPVFEKGIEVALKLHENTGKDQYLNKCFAFAEKSKAYLLSESLRESAAKQKAGIPVQMLDQEKQLRLDIAFYQKQIFEAQFDSLANSDKILRWQAEILDRRRASERLLAQFEAQYPEYYQVKYRQKGQTIQDVQRALPENTGMLEYFQGDRATYAFYIDKTTARTVQCPADSMLAKLLHQIREQDWVEEHSRSLEAVQDFTHAAHALYQNLLAPLVTTIPAQLIVIPDGQLSYLPFELLLTDDTRSESRRPAYDALPYLLRKTTIRYEYSALLATQPLVKNQARRFFDGYAPAYQGEANSETARSGPGSCQGWKASDFASLANNQREVEQVAGITGGKAITGKNATETYFKQHASEPRILHLAMHGFLNDCDPAYSGLIFSPETENSVDAEKDGILHAFEVYNLHLNAELAVLSACNTGQGQLARGEGVISLARAFKYAGCPNVLMSLWQADDAATSSIMQGVYRHLQAGAGKAEAIRQAKLDYLNSSARNHPFYWSAFVLVGDNEPIQDENNLLWYISGLLLLLVLTLYFRKRRGNS